MRAASKTRQPPFSPLVLLIIIFSRFGINLREDDNTKTISIEKFGS
jgi:hypothetical protein